MTKIIIFGSDPQQVHSKQLKGSNVGDSLIKNSALQRINGQGERLVNQFIDAQTPQPRALHAAHVVLSAAVANLMDLGCNVPFHLRRLAEEIENQADLEDDVEE